MKTFEEALKGLTAEQRELGELPPGFLYCLRCNRGEPYKGVVRFNGFSQDQASGRCLECQIVHTIYKSSGQIVAWDQNNKAISVLPGDGCEDLWSHVVKAIRRPV